MCIHIVPSLRFAKGTTGQRQRRFMFNFYFFLFFCSQGAKFDICHGHDWLAAKALVQCKNMGRNTVATFHRHL